MQQRTIPRRAAGNRQTTAAQVAADVHGAGGWGHTPWIDLHATWVAAAVLVCVAVIAGCATAPGNIPPHAPSPVPLDDIAALDGGRIDVAPRLQFYRAPEYPQEAILENISAVVRLAADVDEEGRVLRVRVLRSLPVFEASCIEAMRAWRFVPARRDGRPVAFTVTVPFSFQLQ